MTSGIYGLHDTDTKRIVYVGRSFDIEHRYRTHLRDGEREGFQCLLRGWLDYPIIRTKANALAYFWLNASRVDFILLEELPRDNDRQAERECFWAGNLTDSGHPLANGTVSSTKLFWNYKIIQKPTCPYTPALRTYSAEDLGVISWRASASKTVIDVMSVPNICRLRNDRPDLFERVLTYDLSPHAAVMEAGFGKPIFPVSYDPDRVAKTFVQHITSEQLTQLVKTAPGRLAVACNTELRQRALALGEPPCSFVVPAEGRELCQPVRASASNTMAAYPNLSRPMTRLSCFC